MVRKLRGQGQTLSGSPLGNFTNFAPKPIQAQRAPTTADTGYEIGQLWADRTNDIMYGLADVAGGIATWNLLGPGASDVDTLTGDSGGAISPVGGNINILGGDGLTVAGAGNTLTINRDAAGGYPITPYVVGSAGEAGYTTIQSAINAANAAGGGSVWIQQGSYTEDLTLADQVYLIAVCGISQGPNEGVQIIGTHTPPTSGHVQANGIYFQSTTDIFASAAAGTAHIQTANCEFAVQNGYEFDLPNWAGIIEIYDCNPGPPAAPFAINDGGINNTGGAQVIVYNSGVGNGTNVMTISGSSFFGQAVTVGCPLTCATGTDLDSVGSQYVAPVTWANNSTVTSTNDSYLTGATAAITMNSSAACSMSNCVIDSTNNPAIAGAGAGTLTLAGSSFLNNSEIAATLTLGSGQLRGAGQVTRFVVGASPDAPYQTIQAGIDAANAAGGGIVVVQPGTYTEDLTLYSNCHVMGLTFADAGGGVVINGTHTPPTSGGFSFNNVELNDASAIFSSAAAGSTHLIIGNSEVNVTNGYTFDLTNWTGKLECYDVNGRGGTNDGWINNAGGSEVALFSAAVGAGTGNTMQLSGSTSIFTCDVGCPINCATGSSAFLEYNVHTANITLANNSTGEIVGCEIDAAITMSSSANWQIASCVINTATNPAIGGAGAGTLTLGDITFINNSTVAGTLTTAYANSTLGGVTSTGNSVFNGGTFTVGSDNATNAITIGSGTTARTINIGNSAAAHTLNIGTTNTTSTTNISAGSGGVMITANTGVAGDIALTSAGTQFQINGGAATDFIGQATLVAGTVTVANTNIAAADKVLLTREGVGASTALGVLDVSITASTSFTITSRQPGTPGSTQTGDVSIVNYFIVRQV